MYAHSTRTLRPSVPVLQNYHPSASAHTPPLLLVPAIMPVPTPTPPHPTDASLKPACKSLVLDAGPLLSLSPLRGLAEHFLTVPQVLSELKDKNAREHFERLGMVTGVRIEVKEPDAASLVKGEWRIPLI